MTKAKDESDRQITGISISPKGKVKVDLATIHTIEPKHVGNGEEGEEEAESATLVVEHSIKTKHRPHKDLFDSLKKLRKYALEICEMISDSKAVSFYTVSGIKISGDLLLKQSRVIMTVTKEIRRTGGVVTFNTPQVTMYGDSEYEKAAEMSKLIEDVLKEVNLYLEGKAESDDQLSLFPTVILQTS